MGGRLSEQTDGYAPVDLVHKIDDNIVLHASIKYKHKDDKTGGAIAIECHPYEGEVEIIDRNGIKLHPLDACVIPCEDDQRVFIDRIKKRRSKTRKKVKKALPNCIVELSSTPDEKCGIATYTTWLSRSMSKHADVYIYRQISPMIEPESIIHSQIEFGIFPDPKMLYDKMHRRNYKVATWHTVLKTPHPEHLEYIIDIDDEYDAHIVHTTLQKLWLSKFVSNPVYIIPHGTLIWNPIDKIEARKRLGLPPDQKIAFSYGFAVESKGFDELLMFANEVKDDDFRLYVSGGIHGVVKEHTEKHVSYLKKLENQKAVVLGRWLTEEETDLWVSAADILVFNYKTPDYIASASGALHRVLSAGKPIVAVDDNRLEELVNGHHCLKFSRGDKEEFADAVELLLSDEEVYEKLGRNCRLLAEETSWDKIAEKHIKVFEKVTGHAI